MLALLQLWLYLLPPPDSYTPPPFPPPHPLFPIPRRQLPCSNITASGLCAHERRCRYGAAELHNVAAIVGGRQPHCTGNSALARTVLPSSSGVSLRRPLFTTMWPACSSASSYTACPHTSRDSRTGGYKNCNAPICSVQQYVYFQRHEHGVAHDGAIKDGLRPMLTTPVCFCGAGLT